MDKKGGSLWELPRPSDDGQQDPSFPSCKGPSAARHLHEPEELSRRGDLACLTPDDLRERAGLSTQELTSVYAALSCQVCGNIENGQVGTLLS